MSTLDAQKSRLLEEITEAHLQIDAIKQNPNPDIRILNYYHDVIARNKQVISSLDKHLGLEQQENTGTF